MDATFTLKQILYGATAMSALVTFIGGGYHLFLKGQFRESRVEDTRLDGSIKKLWKHKDELETKIDDLHSDIVDRLHKLELDAVEKYATKSDLTDAINKFDNHLVKLGDKMDDNQREIMSKILEIKTA